MDFSSQHTHSQLMSSFTLQFIPLTLETVPFLQIILQEDDIVPKAKVSDLAFSKYESMFLIVIIKDNLYFSFFRNENDLILYFYKSFLNHWDDSYKIILIKLTLN